MAYGLPKMRRFFAAPHLRLLCLLILSLPVLLTALPARAEESNAVLARCGIRYPMGYDANTVGDVAGKVSSIATASRGPVSFALQAGREAYTVLASPLWYWRDNAGAITPGAEVTVRGSKSLGRDKNLYIIAQEITIGATGTVVNFRNAAGMPLWSQTRGMQAGRQGGGMHGGSGSGGFMRGRSR